MIKKEKKLELKKIKVASFDHLLTEEMKKINGGIETARGTTWLRIFC